MSDKCRKKCGDCKKDSTVPSLKEISKEEKKKLKSGSQLSLVA